MPYFELPRVRRSAARHRLTQSAAAVSWGAPLVAAAVTIACGQQSLGQEPNVTAHSWREPIECCKAGRCIAQVQVVAAPQLRISEVMSDNEGVALDNELETEDWVELENTGSAAVNLSSFYLTDRPDRAVALPDLTLEPGQVAVLFADGELEEGPRHLPFKLSSQNGETLYLYNDSCQLQDAMQIPPLGESISYGDFDGERSICRYPSPGVANQGCNLERTATLPSVESYDAFDWSQAPLLSAAGSGEVVMNELALTAAGFIELGNQTAAELSLAGFSLMIAPHLPGQPWPTALEGTSVELPAAVAVGELAVVSVPEAVTQALAADENFEGVATLFDAGGQVVDRVDFMSWPRDAALARVDGQLGQYRFCSNATPGEVNQCEELKERPVGNRLRHLRTANDFRALAEGGTQLGIAAVKFLHDQSAGGVTHLLGAARWPLHYTFVREVIDSLPMIDRCTTEGEQLFLEGWTAFSQQEYHTSEGRRFFLGTLVHHGGSDLHTVEFATGDAITPEQLPTAFFEAVHHTQDPHRWAFRPQTDAQEAKALEVNGDLPIIARLAPFVGQTYQPLTQTEGYGVLTYIPTADLAAASLGPDVIVVTDDVPNDIELVGGLITDAFQTPLAHVNVLSQNRGTPNMAVHGALQHPSIADHLGQLVRLSVRADGFEVEVAAPAEAQAFWAAKFGELPVLTPRLDAAATALVDLSQADLKSLPAVGAKAAQIGELFSMQRQLAPCGGHPAFEIPEGAFAIPVGHSLAHIEASGARALLAELVGDPDFVAQGNVRADGLQAIRKLITEHPVDPALLTQVTQRIEQQFSSSRVRFRSSSNTEDLPNFNGAGLYTSFSVELGDEERSVEDGLTGVWASLFNRRAYDERRYANVDESLVAMGVLVHPAFRSELAQGVGISRNLLAPENSGTHYINTQAGEASVTNPSPGVVTEQLTFNTWYNRVDYRSVSSLVPDKLLDPAEIGWLSCSLGQIHRHFRDILDPEAEDRLFAMEVEFKLLRPDRRLLIKQARPHRFSSLTQSADCREL